MIKAKRELLHVTYNVKTQSLHIMQGVALYIMLPPVSTSCVRRTHEKTPPY
jgi:hypothetical protein